MSRLSSIIKLKFKVAVPLFGHIKHHNDAVGAFVHVHKVSIQTCSDDSGLED